MSRLWNSTFGRALLQNPASGMMLQVQFHKGTTGVKTTDQCLGVWNVTVTRSDGTKRVLKPRHVVSALGFGAGEVNMPTYPGMVSDVLVYAILIRRRNGCNECKSVLMVEQENFPGKVLHSTGHRTAKEYAGKKVVILGAATSGILGY